MSVGGNDALHVLHTLQNQVSSVAEVFLHFHRIRKEFDRKYQTMLSNALSYNLPTTVCTIYKPCLSHRNAVRLLGYVEGGGLSNDEQQKITNTALPIINDVIFDDVADYANEIEPSAVGGMKIAKIIKEIVTGHDFSINRTKVYT